MKLIGVLSTAVLSFTLGAGIPAYAQQEQHDQQEENKDKPAQEKEKEKKAQPEKPAKQEEKNARQEDRNPKPEEKNARHEENAKPHDQHARSNGGGRIPDDRYKANFGQGHRFHVSQADYSSRRFQFGGYWFGFEGAWPSNWLYTQDVYVIEIDGVYYLCNANYPGVNITLSVTL
jgi:hypothetical protein